MNRKRLLLILILFIGTISCEKDGSVESTSQPDRPCGTYKSGQSLLKGSEGGCYYINSNGNKTYVEKEACKC